MSNESWYDRQCKAGRRKDLDFYVLEVESEFESFKCMEVANVVLRWKGRTSLVNWQRLKDIVIEMQVINLNNYGGGGGLLKIEGKLVCKIWE